MSDIKLIRVAKNFRMADFENELNDFYNEVEKAINDGYEVIQMAEPAFHHIQGNGINYSQFALLKKKLHNGIKIETE